MKIILKFNWGNKFKKKIVSLPYLIIHRDCFSFLLHKPIQNSSIVYIIQHRKYFQKNFQFP